MRYFALAGLLLFATNAAASERCVNYLARVHGERPEYGIWDWKCESGGCLFTSFNPRSRATVIVARIDSFPDDVAWDEDLGALTYETTDGTFKLNWAPGAVPVPVPSSRKIGVPQPGEESSDLGSWWDAETRAAECSPPRSNDCAFTEGLPAQREIRVRPVTGCNHTWYVAPVTWGNAETGETKVLYEGTGANTEAEGEYRPVGVSTADNLILIASYDGAESIVADLNTGEILLRATGSKYPELGNCPSKVNRPGFSEGHSGIPGAIQFSQ